MKNSEIKIRVSEQEKENIKIRAELKSMTMSEYILYCIRKNEEKTMKKNERIYFVANDNGDIAGHDLDYATAEQCLAEMQRQEPDAGWEILDSNED